jgi:hypothetical protein
LTDALDQSSAQIGSWLQAQQSSPSQKAQRTEDLLRVANALAELPEAQREAVTAVRGPRLEAAEHAGGAEEAAGAAGRTETQAAPAYAALTAAAAGHAGPGQRQFSRSEAPPRQRPRRVAHHLLSNFLAITPDTSLEPVQPVQPVTGFAWLRH